MEATGRAESVWTRPFQVRTLPDKVAGKSRTLSGFSFTALIFVVGFFKDDLPSSGPFVLALLAASVSFLLSAEVADFSLRFWEYFIAQILFVLASIFLFGGFAWFISVKFPFLGWPPLLVALLPVSLYALMLAETLRSIRKIESYDRRNPDGGKSPRT